MSKERINELKKQGKSNREIAKELDVSVQYVWGIVSGYADKYQQTEKARAYQRAKSKEQYKKKKEASKDVRN